MGQNRSMLNKDDQWQRVDRGVLRSQFGSLRNIEDEV